MTGLGWLLFISASLLFAAYGLPALIKIRQRADFLRDVGRHDAVFLTFDDGPHPDATAKILDLLKAHDARATFFVIGRNIARDPSVVERIHAEAHGLGSHSERHSHALKATPWGTYRDLREGHQTLLDAVPGLEADRALFRPPYGKVNLGSLAFSIRRAAWWNVDPKDYESGSGQEIFARLKPQLEPGNVILLHDGRMGQGRTPEATVEATRLLLEYGRQRGLKFAALPASR